MRTKVLLSLLFVLIINIGFYMMYNGDSDFVVLIGLIAGPFVVGWFIGSFFFKKSALPLEEKE